MEVSNRQFVLILMAGLAISASLIGFGILIGQTNLQPVNDASYTDWISSIGSMLAGLGTIGLFALGFRTLSVWRVQKKSENLISLKSSLVLTVFKAREWIHEACICSHPPKMDNKALAIHEELEVNLKLLMKEAANCDAIKLERSNWYVDDVNNIRRFITDTVTYANADNHYPLANGSNNELPSFWDSNKLIFKRNKILIDRSEKLKIKLNYILITLDNNEFSSVKD